MEFKFDVQELLPGNHPVCLINSRLEVVNCESLINASQSRTHLKTKDSSAKPKEFLNRNWKHLFDIINLMGDASAKAQGLLSAITSGDKLLCSQHRLYILKEEDKVRGSCVVGILKVGPKRLFVVDGQGCLHESMTLCVLDFYVQEERQRRGHGKRLFDTMLQVEGIQPERLAIDRPSPKLIAFLQKHYALSRTIPQANNFVVFDSFFPGIKSETRSRLIPRQRHSYCATTENGAQGDLPERAARPRSLAGIVGCAWWPSEERTSVENTKDNTKDRSLGSASSRDSSFGASPNLSSRSNRRSNSSWNIFGVPPPDYLEPESQPTDFNRHSRLS